MRIVLKFYVLRFYVLVALIGALGAQSARGQDTREPARAQVRAQLKAMGGQVPNPHFRPDASVLPDGPLGSPRPLGPSQHDASAAKPDDLGPLPDPPKPNLACRAALGKLAQFEPVDQQSADPYCVIPDPVRLRSVRGTTVVDLPQRFVVDCAFALRFAKFVAGPVQTLAREMKTTQVSRIVTGPGFSCRRRNNSATGKLSEHAFGNAVDINAFLFADGSRQSVIDPAVLDDASAAFQRAVRAAACGPFSTVLGPGSNAAHATHFHFDYGRSKGRKTPYLVCE